MSIILLNRYSRIQSMQNQVLLSCSDAADHKSLLNFHFPLK